VLTVPSSVEVKNESSYSSTLPVVPLRPTLEHLYGRSAPACELNVGDSNRQFYFLIHHQLCTYICYIIICNTHYTLHDQVRNKNHTKHPEPNLLTIVISMVCHERTPYFLK
jgi:hypothetical protein